MALLVPLLLASAALPPPSQPPAPAPPPHRQHHPSSATLPEAVQEVAAERERVTSRFDARFASITFDIQNFIGFKIYPWTYNWSSPKLRRLTQALAPMTVRCGGTWEDGILWEGGPQTGQKPGPAHMPPHPLTRAEWAPFAGFMNGDRPHPLGQRRLWAH